MHEIVSKCRIENIDLDRLKQQTERIGYPILGVVQQIVGLCKDGLGEWCHWGATTQDITDTAAILQIRAALDLVEKDMEAIAASLADLSRKYRDTPMAGRSNLQQAVPLTFGFKMAALLAAMQRHRERLAQMRPRVLVGEFGGAVGNLASLGTRGLEVQAALCQELGLGQPEIAWHTVRDRIGEVGCFLGLVTGTLRQDFDGREAVDADRGGRGLRAVPRGPRLVQHHAAEAQPDRVALHPLARPRSCASTSPRCWKPRSPTTSARPARGRSNGFRCPRFSCSPPARCRRPRPWSPASKSTPRACAPIST